jgi:hypothetical protein
MAAASSMLVEPQPNRVHFSGRRIDFSRFGAERAQFMVGRGNFGETGRSGISAATAS